MTINDAINVLYQVIREPWRLPQQVEEFQRIIWKNKEFNKLDGGIIEILRDLAHDLDFYEPNIKMRAEDESYFGEEKVLAEIQIALSKIASLSNAPNQEMS